jgi:sulfite reductase alpha subunit-like flavoprotein
MGSNAGSKMSAPSLARIGTLMTVTGGLVALLVLLKRRQQQQQRQEKTGGSTQEASSSSSRPVLVKILYGTVTGKAKLFAQAFYQACCAHGYAAHTRLMSMADYDPDDQLLEDVKAGSKTLLVLFCSTYTEGTPPQSAAWFYKVKILS